MSKFDTLSSCDGLEIISVAEGRGLVKYLGEKIATYFDNDGKLFQLNGNPLFISNKINKDGIDTGVIVNKDTFEFGGEQPWTESEQIGIIWDNDKPKIITDSNSQEYLLFINNYEGKGKIVIGNNSDAFTVNYPLENPEEDYYICERNEDFSIGINILNGKRTIFYNNAGELSQISFSNSKIENEFNAGTIELPSKDRMFILAGIIFAFDEEQEELYEVKIGNGIDYEGATYNGRDFEITRIEKGPEDGLIHPMTWDVINKGPNKIHFSASPENPNTPATIEINGTKLFAVTSKTKKVTSLFEDDDDLFDDIQNDAEYNYSVSINGKKDIVYLDNYFEIEGVKFYKFGDSTQNSTKNIYTDGKEIYVFEQDEDGGVKLLNLEGKEYPLKKDYENSRTSIGVRSQVLYVNGNDRKYVPVILQEIPKEDEDENEKIYKELILTEEQKDLSIVGILDNFGVVCLANDISNTLGFKYFKVNSDFTLTYMFRGSFNIFYNKKEGTIELNIGGNYFELIKKQDSISILEPIIKDEKEYFLVVIPSRENRYVKLNNEKDGFEFIQDEFEIDPETLLPIQSKSFEFDSKTFYINKKGTINIGEKKYKLCDINGNDCENYEDSIIEMGGKRILIIKSHGLDSPGIIYGYFEGMDNNSVLQELNIKKKTGQVTYEAESNGDKVQTIKIEGIEYILKYNYERYKSLGIIEITSEGLKQRYINDLTEKHSKFEGEEFVCDGQIVLIEEIVSDTCVKSEDGIFYYREKLTKDLKKIEVHENIKIGNGAYCEPSNYSNYASLIFVDGIFSTTEIDGEKLYLTDIDEKDYPIDGNRINITTFFNPETNKLVSYKKIGDDYKKVNLGGTDDLAFDGTDYINVPSLKDGNRYYSIQIPRTGLYTAKVQNHENDCVLLGYKEGKLFDMGLDITTGEYSVYAVKKIGETVFAVLTGKEGKEQIVLGEGGKISVDGIIYDEELLKFIYDNLTKDIKSQNMDKVITSVVGAVRGAMDSLKGNK